MFISQIDSLVRVLWGDLVGYWLLTLLVSLLGYRDLGGLLDRLWAGCLVNLLGGGVD